jgi:hypothetical protein
MSRVARIGLQKMPLFLGEMSGLGCQYSRNFDSFVSLALQGIAYNSMQEAIQEL